MEQSGERFRWIVRFDRGHHTPRRHTGEKHFGSRHARDDQDQAESATAGVRADL